MTAWREHDEELYNVQTAVDKTILMLLSPTNVDNLEIFMIREIEAEIKRLKRNQSRHIDIGIDEMIKLEGISQFARFANSAP